MKVEIVEITYDDFKTHVLRRKVSIFTLYLDKSYGWSWCRISQAVEFGSAEAAKKELAHHTTPKIKSIRVVEKFEK